MGQDISRTFYPPPLTFQQCFVNNEFCIYRYYIYRRRLDDEQKLFQLKMSFFNNHKKRKFDDFNLATDNSLSSNSSHTRSVKNHKLLVRGDDGAIRSLTPKDTLWFLLYVKSSPQDERLKKIFRSRFRLPYFISAS